LFAIRSKTSVFAGRVGSFPSQAAAAAAESDAKTRSPALNNIGGHGATKTKHQHRRRLSERNKFARQHNFFRPFGRSLFLSPLERFKAARQRFCSAQRSCRFMAAVGGIKFCCRARAPAAAK